MAAFFILVDDEIAFVGEGRIFVASVDVAVEKRKVIDAVLVLVLNDDLILGAVSCGCIEREVPVDFLIQIIIRVVREG